MGESARNLDQAAEATRMIRARAVMARTPWSDRAGHGNIDRGS
jgi:hypothetical protein